MTNDSLIPEYVTDTVGLVLFLEQRKLEPKAKQIFRDAENGKAILFIPVMVLAEILYLSEKGRITLSLPDVSQYLQKHPHFKEYPLTISVVESAAQISDIPELHDRLIAATARLHGVELITNDLTIQASKYLNTIW